MINVNFKNTKDNKVKSYKKVLGLSMACISIVACSVISGTSSYATTNEPMEQQEIVQPVQEEETPLGFKVQEEALKYINVPYVNGGISPNGFDCSGFTKYVLNNVGVDIPRIAKDQAIMDKLASHKDKVVVVNKEDIQAGDLVFFENTPGLVGHVGIALDDNKYIHASYSKKKIVITSRSDYYFSNNFVKAVRVN
ncbi:putative NLP/P60 protein [Gottschalkia acidurici 9a]|uniref:NLP/P60 protein n=1 Tax=Gottschalkia acidurici (strain ATCC 7906 / DSM 604 / BCRC 14475 / CIP 104303 / KCTC 5404 / NCIMB 10678 / 9a) TaxID=1128398 RepID=K0AZ47_GOTA9|nr:C40 family peptidase [Gottschalkia acidurici]AFS78539.1 putative NLP/P60 protein [Gottschalkia acidurici 9a]